MADIPSPSLSGFKETAAGFRYLSLVGTPDLSAIQRTHPDRYPYLLESTARGPNGRYDILFAWPQSALTLHSDGRLRRNDQDIGGTFLAELENELAANTQPAAGDIALPFTGGWFVFLSYELTMETEPTLRPQIAGQGSHEKLPVAMARRMPAAIVIDHELGTTTVVAETGVTTRQQQTMLDDLKTQPGRAESSEIQLRELVEEDPAIYLDAITRTKHYIHEGDIFQANLSRLWQAEVDHAITPFDVYAQLRKKNPAPFSGLILLDGNNAVISSSPERLVSLKNGIVATRPIAGTHPRGETEEADAALSQQLLSHPKERAEHVMLIDLERNDLGRVCRPGSVTVSELMALETYRHVHHIVSEVRGELESGKGPTDIIRAVFPGGTITGCPKVRCMEIIHELEQQPRGAYTGSMGYINRDGSMDLNILIRTLVQHDNTLMFRAGGGIVADSEPEKELAETRAKAKGMLRAIGQEH